MTKRGLCHGERSKISWTQVETGSAITWKYPSVVLAGDHSVGEFYSVALTNNAQQADTGTKMIHVGKNTRSRIVSKGISAGRSRNCYRGLVQVQPSATGARNHSQCDSMLIGDRAGANTYPYISARRRRGPLRPTHSLPLSPCFARPPAPFSLRGAARCCCMLSERIFPDPFPTLPPPTTTTTHPPPARAQVREPSANVEHEASTSKIGEDQLFYFQQRGIDAEKAVGAIISGFCREVFNELPLEFAAEVNELMSLKLEGSVG